SGGAMSIGRYFTEMMDPTMSWDDVTEMVRAWNGKFCLKGVMSVADAKRAAEIGCAGIVLSNHGGRQLDGSRAPFDQLAEIVDAVGDRIDVIMDGGIQRGTHVLKALSLGAKAVGVGRYYLYPLAAAGQAGVERALGLMQAELERGMKLMGCTAVNLLCERVAELLGKEAAVFMPSGTMCNVTATLSHCRPGDEILAHVSAHIIAREGGAHAALGGFQITPLPGDDGQFTPEVFRAALHPRSRYQPPQTVVSVEQTANIGGGTIWKKAALDEVVSIAKANGLVTHMDGARLLNACVATGISARHMAAGWDSAWIDCSKGLGAPIGGVIAGSRDFIDTV